MSLAHELAPCEKCDDGDGCCVFPYYGVGPHRHARGAVLGITVLASPAEWPENYTEDPDCPGLGTYTHCPHCGAPGESA